MRISFELQDDEIGRVDPIDEKEWLNELISMGLKVMPQRDWVIISKESPTIFYKDFNSLEEFITWMGKTPLNLISMWQNHNCDFVIQTTYLG